VKQIRDSPGAAHGLGSDPATLGAPPPRCSANRESRTDTAVGRESGAETTFASIAARLLEEPGTTKGTGFGVNPGLRAHGKVFVMLVVDELVVRLPEQRCAEIVEAGEGRHFDRGKRLVLREWVAFSPVDALRWTTIANEALAFTRADLGRREDMASCNPVDVRSMAPRAPRARRD